MLSFLPRPIVMLLTWTLTVSNVIIMCSILICCSILKLLIPIPAFKVAISQLLIWIAEAWISINGAILGLTQSIDWEVSGLESLEKKGWYLVISNHQSWVDILVLQKVFNHRIPFLKFFLKKELIWVPFLGIAWWALDFPFMQRFSKSYLKQNPHMAGKDLETTRKACEKFKYIPVSVMNFLEGTRFTDEKHNQQNSPYRHLLKPKAGGMAFVLSAMGGQLKSMVDVTICYPGGARPTIHELFSNRVCKIKVIVQQREIPAEFLAGDYQNDDAYRAEFQSYVSELWQEKDDLIESLKAEEATLK